MSGRIGPLLAFLLSAIRLVASSPTMAEALGEDASIPGFQSARIMLDRGRPGARLSWSVRTATAPDSPLRIVSSENGSEWVPFGLIPTFFGDGGLSLDEPTRPIALFRLAAPLGRRLLLQDFSRASDTGPGTLPNPNVGDPWEIRGIGWTGPSVVQVTNGVADDPDSTRQISYLCQRFPTQPQLLEMSGEWRPFRAGGTVESTFVMALSTAAEGVPWFWRCVHVRFHRDSVAVDTSNNGPITVNRWVSRLPHRLETQKVHHFATEVEGSKLILYVDGIAVLMAQHPDIGQLAGPLVFWELYSDAGIRRNTTVIRMLAASAARR
jgi:hypothetical protein